MNDASAGDGDYRVLYQPARDVQRYVREGARQTLRTAQASEQWHVTAGGNRSWPHDAYEDAVADAAQRNRDTVVRRDIVAELQAAPAPPVAPAAAAWARRVDDNIWRTGQIAAFAVSAGYTDAVSYRADVEAHLRALAARSRIKIRTASTTVSKVLRSGQFRNQISVRTKRDHVHYNPAERRRIEHDLFGTPVDAKPAAFCIYGYLAEPAEPADRTFEKVYGDAVWVLRDEVRSRATAILGDLLDNYDREWAVPAPVDTMSLESVGLSRHAKPVCPLGRTTMAPAGGGYVDVQIHGGVTLAAVDYLLWPQGLADDTYRDTIAALQVAGVRVLADPEA